MRVFRLCLLSILLPGVLIAGPLYLRYKVFSEQVYPLGLSDMRLVDGKISTTWCQKQLVKSNVTFSAYLLPEEPKVKSNPVVVKMVKYLNLEDDMKEYWGFYLLKDSSVTVSTCCRWPGASLIVIKGHSHLRECAYIGDNSSEELEELEEFDRQKAEEAKYFEMKEKTNSGSELWPLKKARDGVEFLTPSESSNDCNETSQRFEENVNILKNDRGLEMKSRRGNELLKSILNPYLVSETESRGNSSSGHETLLLENHKKREDSVTTENSEEIYENIKKQLRYLRNRKSSLVSRLKAIFHAGSREENQTVFNNKEQIASRAEEGKHFISPKDNRNKREITLWSLQRELNKDDDFSDAAEEDVGSKEDIRGTINGTTANDMSNSEFWSSFSSSEERLLSCTGLILNLPLTPSKSCHPSKPENTQTKASLMNKLTYKVPANGYYFFVFSSENEIQPNYIRIHFHLEKMIYNVSNPVAACMNTTDSCSLPLNFFSREKVVLEMPVNSNETASNQEYVVISVCEPRTMVYAACVIAVPILILLFAF